MHSGGKYVVIIVFRTAICQLSPFRYLLDPHSSCWVSGWDSLCVSVFVGETLCLRPSSVIIPYSPYYSSSLRLSLSDFSKFICPLQIEFVFLNYLHFSETKLFLEYTNVTRSVYVLCVF